MSDELGSGEVGAVASGGGSFVTRLVWLFTAPKKLFGEIASGEAHWWQPWVWVSLLSAAVAYISLPVQKKIASLNPGNVSAEQLEQTLEGMEKFGFLGVISAPVAVLVPSAIVVGIAYLVLSVLSESANFKKYFTLYLYASIVPAIGMLLGTSLTRMRGVDSIRSIGDATSSFGPAILADYDQKIMHSILTNLDLFSLWFYILIGMGTMHIFGLSKRSALVAVLPLWLVAVLVTLVMRRLGS